MSVKTLYFREVFGLYVKIVELLQTGTVFEYAFKRREYLGKYFKNGDCAISNNAAENAIRPFNCRQEELAF